MTHSERAAATANINVRRVSLTAPGFAIPTAAALMFAVWQLASFYVDDDLFLPAPTQILGAFWELLRSGELLDATGNSVTVFIIGLSLSLAIGLPLGVAMALNRWLGVVGGIYVMILWATPAVALLPVLIKAFGLSITTKAVIVVLAAVFPIIINTRVGIRNVDWSFREMAQSFGADRWQIIRDVLIPGSLPYVVAGIQIGIGRAVIGVVVAELFTSVSGLGALMVKYANFFQTDKYFAGLIMFVLFSMTMNGLVSWLSSRFARQ